MHTNTHTFYSLLTYRPHAATYLRALGIRRRTRNELHVPEIGREVIKRCLFRPDQRTCTARIRFWPPRRVRTHCAVHLRDNNNIHIVRDASIRTTSCIYNYLKNR